MPPFITRKTSPSGDLFFPNESYVTKKASQITDWLSLYGLNVKTSPQFKLHLFIHYETMNDAP